MTDASRVLAERKPTWRALDHPASAVERVVELCEESEHKRSMPSAPESEP